MQLQLDPIYKLTVEVLGACEDVQHIQKPKRAEDADKNFDNIIAAKKLFDCRSTASNFTLITCRSPIYTRTFLLGIDRRSTSSNFSSSYG